MNPVFIYFQRRAYLLVSVTVTCIPSPSHGSTEEIESEWTP